MHAKIFLCFPISALSSQDREYIAPFSKPILSRLFLAPKIIVLL
ncbi:Uncharacterised protein [Chlamydia trachomatis]|nr:Uncharacterised protein [Chlamydia trachomatis]